MGWGRTIKGWFSAPVVPESMQVQRRTFGSNLPQLVAHWAERYTGVSRRDALSIPAVLKGRNLICSVSTLPLVAKDQSNREVPLPLLSQHDPNVPNGVVMSQVLEDLLFDAVAWWRVTGFDEYGRPSQVARYAPDTVSLQPPDNYQKGYLPSELPTQGVIYMEGKPVPFDQVIRFDSPNPGILDVGARVIARALALDATADLLAASPKMRGYFTAAEGEPDPEDEEIEGFLSDWRTARANNVDGWVPANSRYNTIQDPTPSELQLIEMQKRNDLGIANMLGIDPEDLGISTTSRTYQNAVDRRQDRINTVFAPYMDAITDRLNMPDVTRPGLIIQFKLDDYLKADPKTRAEVQQIYAGMGVTDGAEIREQEGLSPRVIETPAVASVLPVRGPRRVSSTLGQQEVSQ